MEKKIIKLKKPLPHTEVQEVPKVTEVEVPEAPKVPEVEVPEAPKVPKVPEVPLTKKKVYKLKTAVVLPQVEVKVEVKVEAKAPVKAKKIIKLNCLPVPPVSVEPLTKAMEAFEAIREYYKETGEPIPQADIKWFHAEIEQEKKDMDAFWAECNVTKVFLDAVEKGYNDDEIDIAVAKAQIEEKKKPIKETDLGPTPSYGTPEFWAWCMKRKKLRLQKEAEIIAAGGTVPPEKPKKPRKPKAPSV